MSINLRVVAVTMGDPSGIGPEIVIKGCSSRHVRENGIPVIIGDYSVLREVAEKLNFTLDIIPIHSIEEADSSSHTLNVIDVGYIGNDKRIKAGEISLISGEASVQYIKKATELALRGEVQAVATAPINKKSVRRAGYQYNGHTELFGELTSVPHPMTMFSVGRLKIFFHSRHVSLRSAIELLNIEGVYKTLVITARCLESIGYKNPKIALAALNPHASDGGMFGNEEEKILLPACDSARARGIIVDGPLPADSVFHLANEGNYDGVVSLYHDQGHIAAKSYDFYRTVSVTLGLPFIRTSVDHGTAFNIAWKGIANPLSMEEAIISAFDLSRKYRPSVELF